MRKHYLTKTQNMKVNKTIGVLFLSAFTTISYSQEVKALVKKERKNSIGLEFRVDENFPNIGFTYRRFFKDSKYNLRLNLNLANFDRFGGSGLLSSPALFETNDSTRPIMGIDNSYGQSGSSQKIEIGLERIIDLHRFKFIVGADLFLGHDFRSKTQNIVEMEKYEFTENGSSYFKYQLRQSDSIFNGSFLVNSLIVNRNYVKLGANLRVGVKHDFSSRLYTTAFFGARIEQSMLVRESINYSNDSFKERLTYSSSINILNITGFLSIGLHYRF